MYVTDATNIDYRVKAVLETNPFAMAVRSKESSIELNESNLDSQGFTLNDLITRAENTRVVINIEKQKLKKNTLELKHLQKTLENSSNDFSCNFLKTTVIEKFFSSIGLKFVSLAIKQDGQSAELTYVRPTRFLESLPIPPMVITLRYAVKQGQLVFTKPAVFCNFRTISYIHPHINSTSICMGNFFDVMNQTNSSLLLEGYQDQVILLESLLSTYNPDSPYRTPNLILADLLRRVTFDEDQEINIDNYSTYTFKSSALNSSSTSYMLHNLITRELSQGYLDSIKAISYETLVSDSIDHIAMWEFDGSSDDLDIATSIRNGLIQLYGNMAEFAHIESDFESDNSDDEEGENEYLSEYSFESLKKYWTATLVEFSTSEGFKDLKLELSHLPDLNRFYISVPFITEGVDDVFN